ncbi:Eisosome assembly protein [Neonectria magnoliae]|uniref:Eisosome assembly protein n=1 Tax=Neonectria magnoliae TaxID=2732573 RepID=A0ABR1HW29_9HYPO
MIQTPSPTAPGNNSGRLKYADPRDLPSYPSTGLRPDGAAASAAASLGWSNQRPIAAWKPGKLSSASAAAVLAKDYKMAPPWEPASNSAGHQAALLALGSANTANKVIPKSPQEGWGSSAASQAFNTNRSNSMRQIHPSTSTKECKGERSLAAAKGAMSGTRPRAISTPSAPPARDSYPLESMAASNALSGATLAHQASLRSKPSVDNSGAVSVTTMTRSMFTSQPPVKPEVDERQNNEKLHASAIAMARQIYNQQQKMADQTKDIDDPDSGSLQTKPHINLQEAAYKQAQERLAKLENEHQKNREFNDYYGNTPAIRHRFSLSSKLRRRSSSDGDLNDHQQTERIRQQMSLFTNKLSEVDEQKRKKDRDMLLAVAQRNVTARLQGMDQKVYNETGQVNPTLLTEWEFKASQVAYANHASRTENKGKVDIGGGKFMDAKEVDAIASKRVQPVLDDINEKAAVERERLAVLKMEEETRKAEVEKEKQDKEDEKAKKAEAKAAKAEEKRQAKEEKRTLKPDSTVPAEDDVDDQESIRGLDTQDEPATGRPTTAAIDTDTTNMGNERRKSNDSAKSPSSKVKGWIKQRFSRGKSMSETEKQSDKRRGFVGGAALRDSELNRSTASLDNRPSSMRDVALAGRTPGLDATEVDSLRDSRGVSPISSGTSSPDCVMTPPRPIGGHVVRDSHSPSRDSRFREMMDQ